MINKNYMKNKYLYSLLAILFVGSLFTFTYTVSNKTTIEPLVENTSVRLKNGDAYNLTASFVTKMIAGKEQKMLAYNGSIPGPTIEVTEGDEVTINFINKTDTNQLLHSHGIRMENAYDGSHLVQKEMKPGETFSYKLKFSDPGIYWYHPHINEVYGQTRGLYGAFIVKPKDSTYFPSVNKEVPLFLSDVLIENDDVETSKGDGDHQLMGHYGNVLLTNGQENYTLSTKQGDVVRLYLVNSANARPFNFKVNGAVMKLIGGDSGAYEKATFVDSVTLGPSERAIVDVLFEKSGTYSLENVTPNKTYTLGTINVSTEETYKSFKNDFVKLQTNINTVKSIDQFRHYFTKSPDKKITLTIDMMGGMMKNMEGTMMGHDAQSSNSEKVNLMGMQMTREQAIEHCKMMPNMSGCEPYLNGNTEVKRTVSASDGIEWEDTMATMNQMATKDMVQWKIVDDETKKENMDINWMFKKNQPVKIRIYNDPNSPHPMQHPIHFHGQRFLVVSRDGVAQTNLVWKDTALVKSGETVDIVLDPTNIGIWMAHCHITEHLANGMALVFKVED